jgi:hypothetical protein
MEQIVRYDLLCYKDNKQDINSSIIEKEKRIMSWYHEQLLHPGQTIIEMAIRNTITWSVLTQDVENLLFIFNFSSMSNYK